MQKINPQAISKVDSEIDSVQGTQPESLTTGSDREMSPPASTEQVQPPWGGAALRLQSLDCLPLVCKHYFQLWHGSTPIPENIVRMARIHWLELFSFATHMGLRSHDDVTLELLFEFCECKSKRGSSSARRARRLFIELVGRVLVELEALECSPADALRFVPGGFALEQRLRGRIY